jgi:hypothetical protein
MSLDEFYQPLRDAMDRHLPAAAVKHIYGCQPAASRAAAGNPLFVVESYDRDMRPLQANVGASDDKSVHIYVNYQDGRWHNEVWVDGKGEITDGLHHEPKLWAEMG